MRFAGGSVVKNPPTNAGDRRHEFDPWVRNVLPDVRIPERKREGFQDNAIHKKGSQGFLPQPTQWCRVRKSLKQRLLPKFIRYA